MPNSSRFLSRPRGKNQETIAISGCFALTLVLVAPLWVVIASFSTAIIFEAVRRRGNLVAAVFNVVQYGLLALSAREAFTLVSGQEFYQPGALPPPLLPAMAAAGLAYYLVNFLIITSLTAISAGTPLRRAAGDVLRMHAASTALELSIVPFAVLTVAYSVVLLPILLLPVVLAVRHTRLAAACEDEALRVSLTGLPGRVLLAERYDEAREERSGNTRTPAILLIGLDQTQNGADRSAGSS